VKTIEEFIAKLTNLEFENTQNPYAGKGEYPEIRRENLRLYLTSMKNAKSFLIGEAPGYRGCGLTGIPFTSEDIMLNKSEKHNLFGSSNGYRQASDEKSSMKENTATIVWETVCRFEQLPVMWNAFPLHPHKPGNVESNRKPTIEELKEGSKFVLALIRLSNIKTVIAVGKQAEQAVRRFLSSEVTNISKDSVHQVRHPSFGGKTEFVDGLKAILD
jgi:uracil-DNA glycosylase